MNLWIYVISRVQVGDQLSVMAKTLMLYIICKRFKQFFSKLARLILLSNYYCAPDLQLHTLPLINHNLLITGDFNGHSPSWRYADLSSRGEQIEDWMIENNLILINRPDDQPTHLSDAWKTLSTPDFAIAEKIFRRYVTGRFTPS